MGEQRIKSDSDPQDLRIFMQKLLDDVRALERMLDEGLIETGVTRIGAEQELFLIDRSFRPAPVATQVLEKLDDPRFTTELARFNLEFNLDPLLLGENCLSQLHEQLDIALEEVRQSARLVGAEVVLTGILPTLEKTDLGLDNMTPVPRYHALADAVARLRGGQEFEFHITGHDELRVTHDSVMLESCNTSFQIHFQVNPEDFTKLYNISQAVVGPVLAAATHSPLLFGHRLWRETRIALFQQAVDTRSAKTHLRRMQPRVNFVDRWVNDSALEIFREDIARFRLLISTEIEEDPFEKLSRGEAPGLKALRLHNGTVYRWNRPCYGIIDGKPHLRIENRVLPSGPSVVDEVANAAFWFGLIRALHDEYGDITRHLPFDAVRENFFAAARLGLKAEMHWIGGTPRPATDLILAELLPRARSGLKALGISAVDRSRYLDVIEERVRSRRTGSRWLLQSLKEMNGESSAQERFACLTAATLARQQQGRPIHEWPLANLTESDNREHHYTRVSSLMTTDLFTVNEDEVIDLVADVMDWKHIRHVPVEDNAHRLVGLVNHRILLRVLARQQGKPRRPIPVREVMVRNVVTATPDTSTLEAIDLMKEHKIACLPVVENDRLVGILSERDFMRISGQLLEDFLRRTAEDT